MKYTAKSLSIGFLLITSLSLSVFANTEPPQTWSNTVEQTDNSGNAVMIMPIKGQIFTDVHHDFYNSIKDKIIEANPDLIVFEMECRDFKTEYDELSRRTTEEDIKERNPYVPPVIKEITRLFRVDMKDINQVIWVKDTSGASTPLSLAWETMYMSPQARLLGTFSLARRWNYLDLDNPVRAKFHDAAVGHAKNIAALGKRDPDLAMAFVDPAYTISGRWEGKKVVYDKGANTSQFPIDSSEQFPLRLSSSDALDLAVSMGTIETLEDLLLLEGIRTYHIVGEDISQSAIDYGISWRKDFAKAKKYFEDAVQFGSWATGDNQLKYLRKQISSLRLVLKLMKKWPGVEMRMGWDYENLTIANLEYQIKELEKQYDRIRKDGQGRGSGGGGGRPGGGGAR